MAGWDVEPAAVSVRARPSRAMWPWIGLIETGEQAEQCALARAGRAEDDGPIRGKGAFHLKVKCCRGARRVRAQARCFRSRAFWLAWRKSATRARTLKPRSNSGGATGGGVVEVFHLVVEHDGKRARGAGNVAAEHEDDAELADGVKKAEHNGGEKRAASERNKNARDKAHGTCAEKARGVDQSGVDGGEAGDERLHGEGQAVDDRADDEAVEREGEWMAEQRSDAAAEGCAGPKQDEKKEAENGGRQNHGQRGECFKQRRASGRGPARAAPREERRWRAESRW